MVSRVVKSVLLTSIFGSVFAAVTATLPDISSDARLWLGRLSIVTFFIFLVEYLARVVSAPGRDPGAEQAPAKAVLEYVRSPLGVIDAIVVLLQLGHAIGWFGPVVARLGAVAATVKVARYSTGLRLLMTVLRNESRSLLAALIVMLVLLLLAATLMYTLEHDAQPQLFSSIPASLWWAMETISTVGYGDVFPVTPAGRICAGVILVLGIALYAVPVGILATGFNNEVRRRDFVVTWNTVAGVPLFKGLNAVDIGAIAQLLKPQIVPAHYVIVQRGEPAAAMFFVIKGEVEVDVLPHPVRLHGGEFFGEIGLLRDVQRTATVTAITDTELLELDVVDFKMLMKQFPEIRHRVTQVAEERIPGDR